ncbi:MAG: hypothetical protein RL653_1450 [Pseudomonadota bacterium]|jgi:hypothetical protein
MDPSHPLLGALDVLEPLFEQMISTQRQKVLRLAREAVPNVGLDDILNPHDFPQLKAHPTFEYEDGLLAGLMAAQMAARAEIRQRVLPPQPPR